jgi:very-short-patch-repair endonuclease
LNSTEAEKMLWSYLRASQIEGYKFRRQHPLGIYIVDFVCLKRKLIVEVDGGQHAERLENDEARSAWLTGQGFRVLRFWNNEVLEEMEAVLEVIRAALTSPPS